MEPITGVVDGKWTIKSRLGTGGYSDVYRAQGSRGLNVVVKVGTAEDTLLQKEAQVYEALGPRIGFPKCHYFGVHDRRKVLVLQRLYTDFSEIQERTGHWCSVVDLLLIGIQLLDRLEALHSCSYAHGDIQPANIMLSRMNSKWIYLIDFGSAAMVKEYHGQDQTRERMETILAHFQFCSSDIIRGFAPTKRDDMISMIYTLVHLKRGWLPWAAISSLSNNILSKDTTAADVLCAGLPNCFISVYNALKSMSYLDDPPYDNFRRQFREELQNMEESENSKFSWQS